MVGKRGSLKNRFDAKIAKTDEGCWLWLAVKNNMGYGMLSFSSAVGKRLAHRISYELHVGPIPDGMCVLHRCDTPACVNPEHLFLGSKKDNVDDMDAKGRRVVGINPDNKPPIRRADQHHKAKLNSHIVKECRIRHADGESLSGLAREFGVNKSAMRMALRGEHWPEAGGPLAPTYDRFHESYHGSTHANSKLTEEVVKQVRERHANGESNSKLAKSYGVSTSVMSDATSRRSWKHVT